MSTLPSGNGGVSSPNAEYGTDAWYFNNIPNAVATIGNNLVGLVGLGPSDNTASGAVGLGGKPSAPQGAQPSSDSITAAISSFTNAFSGFTKTIAGVFSADTAQRGTFIVVGIVLLFIGGIVLLASGLVKAANENPGAVAAIA